MSFRILLCCLCLFSTFVVGVGVFAQQSGLTLKDVLFLKQVGYSEGQLRAAIAKARMVGRFSLSALDVGRLKRAGFSSGLIRWMGTEAAARVSSSKGRESGGVVVATEKRRALKGRVQSAGQVAFFSRAQLAPWLRVLLYSPSIPKRLVAARQLAAWGPRALGALPELVGVLRLPMLVRYQVTSPLKNAALFAIGRMGTLAIQASPMLIGALADSLLRERASWALERVVSPQPGRIFPLLRAILRSRSDGAACLYAAAQIARIGPGAKSATADLIFLLRLPTYGSLGRSYVPNYKVKRMAIYALGWIGDTSPAVLQALFGVVGNSLTADVARQALDRLFLRPGRSGGARSLRVLLAVLRKAKQMEARIFAARHLSYMGPLAAPATLALAKASIIQAPYHPQLSKLRRFALSALAGIGPKALAALPHLWVALGGAERSLARRAFERILSPARRFVPQLIQTLSQRRHQEARLIAVEKLALLGRTTLLQARPALMDALASLPKASLSLRTAAARAMLLLGQDASTAVGVLTKALTIVKGVPNSASFRVLIARVLGAIGPKAEAAVLPLFSLLGDRLGVAQAASQALDKIIEQPMSFVAQLKRGIHPKSPLLLRIYAAKQLSRLQFSQGPTSSPDPDRKAAFDIFKSSLSAPGFLWSAGLYNLAVDYAQRAKFQAAFHVLRAAVDNGFDDYIALQRDSSWRPVRRHSVFLSLYKTIRISALDRAELFWLHRETQTLHHETSMMIIQNMNRKDSGWTSVAQSKIPFHPTHSHSVQLKRHLLMLLQKRQKIWVLQSDLQRRSHLLNMSILRNMGPSKRYGYYSRQAAQLRSRQLARLQANRRRRQVLQRRFVRSLNASRVPLPPPAYTPGQKKVPMNHANQLKLALRAMKAAIAQKQWQRALLRCSQAIALSPLEPGLYEQRMRIHIGRKQMKAALKDINEAVRLRPKNTQYLLAQSGISFALGRYRQTILSARQALVLEPRLPDGHNNIGAALIRLGRYKDSIPFLSQALKLNSQHVYALNNMAYVAHKLNQPKAAQEWIKKAMWTAANNSFVQYTRACILARQQRLGDALEALRIAFDAGFDEEKLLKQEPALAVVRRTVAYQTLVHTYLRP